jgi:hypothetical protein
MMNIEPGHRCQKCCAALATKVCTLIETGVINLTNVGKIHMRAFCADCARRAMTEMSSGSIIVRRIRDIVWINSVPVPDLGWAAGYVSCIHCGHFYRDHPQAEGYPYLKLLCEGAVVKL